MATATAPVTQTPVSVVPAAQINCLTVPKCKITLEKCAGGMKMICKCDDEVTCNMIQALCAQSAGCLCSVCCVQNGSCVCCCNMTMCKCTCEMTADGCCITCTSGDAECCKMIQACCDQCCALMACGCTCCICLNGMPVCCC